MKLKLILMDESERIHIAIWELFTDEKLVETKAYGQIWAGSKLTEITEEVNKYNKEINEKGKLYQYMKDRKVEV